MQFPPAEVQVDPDDSPHAARTVPTQKDDAQSQAHAERIRRPRRSNEAPTAPVPTTAADRMLMSFSFALVALVAFFASSKRTKASAAGGPQQ